MTALRDAVATALWGSVQPQCRSLMGRDVQGWNSDHSFLAEAITRYRPGMVVEIGVWKGASVITMATRMRTLQCDGCVIAVDTWLGSAEHWLHDEIPRQLGGMSMLFDLFMSNVQRAGLLDYVVPLPLDSLSAATVLASHGMRPTVIHLDGAHDHQSVTRDLKVWWPLLVEGGMLIADDYGSPYWPDVKAAVDDFFFGMDSIDAEDGKCRIVKRLTP